MASGTADLQRDLGGAIMQSIFGALLTAGYAAAAAAAIAAAPPTTRSPTASRTSSRSPSRARRPSREQYPQYASQITAAAKQSFLDGDHWAYTAGIVAVLLGALLVFFMFPKQDEEQRLLAALPRRGRRAGRAASPCARLAAPPPPLTPEQLRARDRWQSRWNLPIIVAAVVPLFVNSPNTRWVQVLVGLGSWIVFVVDLVVQRRIVPDYLRRPRGQDRPRDRAGHLPVLPHPGH